MPSKYSADNIMEKACDVYCKYPVLLKDDEELLQETCGECRLEAMVRGDIMRKYVFALSALLTSVLLSVPAYQELTKPGEKVQIDVKEVPYHCLKGAFKRDGKHLYQWTAIDECTRFRFVYGYEEHTPENSVDFLERLLLAFPFPIQTVQTDNGTEFTYRFISDTLPCPFEEALAAKGISYKLIPPKTPCSFGFVQQKTYVFSGLVQPSSAPGAFYWLISLTNAESGKKTMTGSLDIWVKMRYLI